MSIPLDDRKKLWAWYHASGSFEHCKFACEYLLKNHIVDGNPIYFPILAGLVTCYGRPFKFSRGVPQLPEEIIPDAYKAFHKRVLHLRDKLLAHVDAENSTFPSGELGADMIFQCSPLGQTFMILDASLKPESLRTLVALCQVLIAKCLFQEEKLFKRYGKDLPRRFGHYRLGIRPGDPEFKKIAFKQHEGF